MPRAGQEIESADGTRLRFMRTAAETGGELLEMEASYPGTGQLPPPHFHPSQAERFDVLSGTVRAVIDGEERTYSQGEAFEVPPGTMHQMGADSPATFRWEVRPALRTAEFFERLYGDPPQDAESGKAFLEEFSAEFRLAGA